MTRATARLILAALTLGALGCRPPRVSSDELGRLASGPTPCATTPSADATVYESTQLDKKPVPRSVPPLDYPSEAKSHRIHGRELVSLVVNADGSVERSSVTRVESSDPVLYEAARGIVSQATFWPACRNGVAVRARTSVAFEFQLGTNPATIGFAALAGIMAGVVAVVMH
jgi:TonB family protein